MSKHSPGPWTWRRYSTADVELVGPGRVFIDDLRAADGSTVIADDSGRDMDVRMADADIIAAAPEMLALLREALSDPIDALQVAAWLERVRELLKRLDGES